MDSALALILGTDPFLIPAVQEKTKTTDFRIQVARFEDLAAECENPRLALLIIVGTLTEEVLTLLRTQTTVTPYISILHVCDRGPRVFASSLLYRKVKSSCAAKAFARHAQELHSVAKLDRERDQLSRISRLAMHFDRSLGTLEFKAVISNFFGLLQTETGAGNLIWISLRKDDLKLERAGAIQWRPLSSRPTQVEKLENLADWLREHRDVIKAEAVSEIDFKLGEGMKVTGTYLPRSCSVLFFVDAPKRTSDITLSLMPFVDGVIERAIQYSEMRQLTFMDDLTELYNQRYLFHVLNNEIARADRAESGFCVLFIDADGLKKINDQHGHLIGSGLISKIGQIVKNSCRASDFGFRYGGDEYVIILTDTDLSQGALIAERVRALVESTTFVVQDLSVNLTLSIGVAAYPDHARTPEQIVAMADRAMYSAKKKSRNFVYIAS